MSNWRTGLVTGVVTNADTSVSVNVSTGGPDGLPQVPVFNPGYYPAVGDMVAIVEVATGSWICVGTSRRDRGVVVPVVPTVYVQNTAPGGVGTIWDQMSASYASHGVGVNPDMLFVRSSTYTPPPTTAGQFIQLATASSSWGDAYGWRTDSFRLYQGTYGYGVHRGLWYYPSMTAALSGKTINRVRIDLSRLSQGGSAGAVQLSFYLHAYASQPAGMPAIDTGPIQPADAALSWGGSALVDLPLSYGAALQGGTALGIAIYAPTQAEYAILPGPSESLNSGRLVIDYT